MTPKAFDARLDRIEARLAAHEVPEEDAPMTPAEAVACILVDLRNGGVVFQDGAWLARFIDCAKTAAYLNELHAAQPDWVLVPLWPSEFTRAIEAHAAGRLRLARTEYLQYSWPNHDARTNTPRLTHDGWPNHDVSDLAHDVHTACYHVHCQTGDPMPATLEDFGAWLRTWQPFALPAELEHET